MNQRLTCLDSTRGIAAFFVVISHIVYALFPHLISSYLSATPLHLFWDGDTMVLYFFTLSGFVLAQSFHPKEVSIKNTISFYIRRIFRIYPAFIFTLLFSYLLLNLYRHSAGSEWLNDYFKINFSSIDLIKQSLLVIRLPNDPFFRIIPHDWTLSIEMMLSFLFPFLLLLFRKTLLTLPIVWILVKLNIADPFTFDFAAGIFISRILHQHSFNKSTLIIFFLFAIILLSSVYRFPELRTPLNTALIHYQTVANILLLLIVLNSEKVKAVLMQKALTFIGRISYSLYLIHFIILYLLTGICRELSPIVPSMLTIIFSIITAYLMHLIIELRGIKLGRKVAESLD